ncbi:hypothetical protein DVA86_25690 [Streptomyces armeniacus]|uniref:Uncharacterized protein n=1 Tax=Streptomyces armeniacus TaxID=83291 RepID=A0A345XV71_9ACTN|nr:hypothetical protein [Streptomyces armeniacus]AXK35537.1 hypothetical protein DVA86_25690 [Streptomyces armeniacus]
MLDVSEDVRAEIGEDEATRLLAGENAPGSYDCTSCRTPGDTERERTSTVLFVGEETAVLAFAHATCVPSQVVSVSEEQLQGAVRSITGQQAGQQGGQPGAPAGRQPGGRPGPQIGQQIGQQPVPDGGTQPATAGGGPGAADSTPATPESAAGAAPRQAVLGVTCGQVLIGDTLHPAIVVEPNGPIARPGSDGPGDDFLPLLIEQGFHPVMNLDQVPAPIEGWSVLLAMGQLHGILQPPPAGSSQPVSWWQAHQPLDVTDGWRTAANKSHTVLVYAAPVGSIGQQPREDLLREALERAAAHGALVAGSMPLAGT